VNQALGFNGFVNIQSGTISFFQNTPHTTQKTVKIINTIGM